MKCEVKVKRKDFIQCTLTKTKRQKDVTTEKIEDPKVKVLENALKRVVFSNEDVLAWLGYFKNTGVTMENFFAPEVEVVVLVATFLKRFAFTCGWAI